MKKKKIAVVTDVSNTRRCLYDTSLLKARSTHVAPIHLRQLSQVNLWLSLLADTPVCSVEPYT